MAIGIALPAIAFLYEFVLVGRKRLDYRVQMDTTATDKVYSEYAVVSLSGSDPAPLDCATGNLTLTGSTAF